MKELIAIQSELKTPKGQTNKFGNYKYRSCEDILEAVKPLLATHNATILITDEVKSLGDYVFKESILDAKSIRTDTLMKGIIYIEATVVFTVGKESVSVKAQAGINPNRKGMDIAQSFGSSSSYARKYALAGLLLLDDTSDADTKDNSTENTILEKVFEEDLKVIEKKLLTIADRDGKDKARVFWNTIPPLAQEELREFASGLFTS